MAIYIGRRELIAALGSTAAWPLAARAQQAQKAPRIGVLLPGTPTSFAVRTNAFLEGLRDLGYVEGKTIAIEWKWAEDKIERFPELAAKLVKANVNVIVTGGTAAAKALKSATRTIPIVMAIIGDPVAAGLVESLRRPGGNATGFSIIAPELGTKRLEFLKEIVPDAFSVAVVLNPQNPQSQIELNEMQAAAGTLGLQLHPIPIASEAVLDEAFAALKKPMAQGVILLTDPILFSQRKRIIEHANGDRLPAMYFFQQFVKEGGLMSYGPSDVDLFRRSAAYVDRILRGTRPSDLPVEQPTKFDLFINLKAARALGLTIPDKVLALADEVIE
jgi:putative tryptophan/tyrosine transport system substrate-binding protein